MYDVLMYIYQWLPKGGARLDPVSPALSNDTLHVFIYFYNGSQFRNTDAFFVMYIYLEYKAKMMMVVYENKCSKNVLKCSSFRLYWRFS